MLARVAFLPLTDAASTPTYKERHMVIGTMQGAAGFYDFNRDMYAMTPREAYEREMYQRRQEEEYRRMQQDPYYNKLYTPAQQQAQLMSQVPKQDPKDPLAFLTKTDNKLLLTGEAT